MYVQENYKKNVHMKIPWKCNRRNFWRPFLPTLAFLQSAPKFENQQTSITHKKPSKLGPQHMESEQAMGICVSSRGSAEEGTTTKPLDLYYTILYLANRVNMVKTRSPRHSGESPGALQPSSGPVLQSSSQSSSSSPLFSSPLPPSSPGPQASYIQIL